jgi:hypothetical protein
LYRVIALKVAHEHFGDLVQQGVGTYEQFAELFLIYTERRQGTPMGTAAEQLRRAVLRWMATRKPGQTGRAMRYAIIPPSSEASQT